MCVTSILDLEKFRSNFFGLFYWWSKPTCVEMFAMHDELAKLAEITLLRLDEFFGSVFFLVCVVNPGNMYE